MGERVELEKIRRNDVPKCDVGCLKQNRRNECRSVEPNERQE